MPPKDLDAVFYVKNVPEISFSDELFHVCYDVGNASFEFVMRPQIYSKAYMLAGEAMAKWQHHSADGDNVRNIKKR